MNKLNIPVIDENNYIYNVTNYIMHDKIIRLHIERVINNNHFGFYLIKKDTNITYPQCT
jgi:hypothetical protein